METIGKNVKRLRGERKWTQEELAERLNVSAQAISKWENGNGLPDISQVVPLANVFGVSTDVLFGLEGTDESERVEEMIRDACALLEYGKPDAHFRFYDRLTAGLKNYPSNCVLLNACMECGLSLSLPENGDLYDPERAPEIADETVRQAKLLLACSKEPSVIMRAHQALLLLYASRGDYGLAFAEAQKFPERTDFTLFSNLERVYAAQGDAAYARVCLCSEIDYVLQSLADSVIRMGKACYGSGRYAEAVAVYETFLKMLDAAFPDGVHPPYQDFDSGDCFLLLAQAYLAVGDAAHAMESVERDVSYDLRLVGYCADGTVERKALADSPLVRETVARSTLSVAVIEKKVRAKLSSEPLEPLRQTERFGELCARVDAFFGSRA